MKLLINYVKDQKKYLVLALFLATINQVFSLLDPQVFRIIVDKYASHARDFSGPEFFKGVFLLLLLSMFIALVSRIAKNFQDYYVSTITQRVGANLYSQSITHSFSLPYSAFEDQRSGELLQKLQKARTDAQNLITLFVGIIFLTLVTVFFVISYAFYVYWLIGLVYLAIIPLVSITQFYLSRKIKYVQKEIVTQTASLAGSTTETLRNVELVKSLGLESEETNRLNTVNQEILSLELKKIKLIRYLSFIQGTFINSVRSALLFVMLYLVWKEIVTFGEFFTLYIYQFFLIEPLGQLGNIANAYQETSASMEKLQIVLDMKSEEKPKDGEKIDKLKSIEYKNVSFNYSDSTDSSIKEVSFSINRGQTIAFVGPSGSGKTTIIKLLLGLYKPTDGQILWNEIDSGKIDYDYLRRKIGYVSQDTQLFAGTIRENLLFVSPNATDLECMDAMKQSQAIKIIERSKEGLNTKIGEGGIKISGGERQRLSIARAILRDPDIIIFDEATSSLDSITERDITETIKTIAKIKPDLVTVIIAHRLSTIMHSQMIFVLEKGELVEKGDHLELIQKDGLYKALWREQEGKT
jgi:ATP-binding cassette, subfamily B, bacterial